MNLPPDRMAAANWVFQFSVLAFVVNLLTIPCNAVIIAQERMGVFALISITEALLKLGFAFILLVAFKDKLIFYSLSMALVALAVFVFNFVYCRKAFDNCSRFKLIVRPSEYIQMGSFVGWNFIGSTATVLSKQGVNVLLNIFCGVIVNAGRGIASQVDNAVNQFINSFTTAIRPQITKTYAAKEYHECFDLINQGTKLIMYLTLLFVIPLTLRTEEILTIWLKTVPDYAVLFTRLSFLILTMDALSTPLYYLMLATGRIKYYQIVAGSLAFLTFPLTWVALKMGFNPEATYYILFFVDITRWIFQLLFLKKIANLNVEHYLSKSMLPVFVVALITIVAGIFANRIIPESILGVLLLLAVTTLVLTVAVLTIGLTRSEREAFFQMLKRA
jgi:O-antigen/teichoic acid export membrane protein